MGKSLRSIDKNLIFKETFRDSVSIKNNCYAKGIISSTGVQLKNGVVKFDGIAGGISYTGMYNSIFKSRIFSIRFNIKFNSFSSIQWIFSNGVNGGENGGYLIYATSSTIHSLFGFVSDISFNYNFVIGLTYEIILTSNGSNTSLYINGILIGTLSNGSSYIRVGNFINVGKIRYNNITTYGNYYLSSLEIYNRILTPSEIKLIYQQNLYSKNIQSLPLLIDFDSTRGVLEDRTGKNTLTPLNIEIKQIGKIKSAYFNGLNSSITTNSSISSNNLVVSAWCLGIYNSFTIIYSSPTYDSFLGVDVKGTLLNMYFKDAVNTRVINQNVVLGKKFNNIVVVSSITKSIIYLNGTQLGNNTTILTSLILNNLNIGKRLSTFFKGYIPKLQIFNGSPLNMDQFISQLYNSQKGQFGL